ncbi:MAG: Mor transcription activator family protein [Bacteroidota bacterium]
MDEELYGPWVNELQIDDLPEGYCRELAQLIGVPVLLTLAKMYGGSGVYIPKIDTMMRSIRDERLAAEFTGDNLHAIVRKYRLSKSRIYEIVEEQAAKKQAGRPQLSLFPGLGA